MAIGNLDGRRHSNVMADINIVPMVDVMLVLLVIFIITAPRVTHAVKVDLPKAVSQPNLIQSDPIVLAIHQDGTVSWNGSNLTLQEVDDRFTLEAKRQPQPELHLWADRRAYYGAVSEVMSLAAKVGITKIGFVSDPAHAP
jgi:biopolymer transport protein ExbD